MKTKHSHHGTLIMWSLVKIKTTKLTRLIFWEEREKQEVKMLLKENGGKRKPSSGGFER